MRVEHFIALRHLRATRHAFLNTLTLLAISGVAIGVAAFTSVVSVAGGFIDTAEERLLGVNPHLMVTKYGVHFSEYERVAEVIAELDGVVSTAPFIVREMLVTAEGSNARPGALVKGIDPGALLANEELAAMVVSGSLSGLTFNGGALTDSNPDGEPVGVAIGKILADRLECEVGDELTLVSPLRGLRSIGVDAGGGANFARAHVAAIVDSGFFDYDNRLIVMDYRAVQELLGLGDVALGVEVRLEDPAEARAMAPLIEASLTTGRFKTMDWQDLNRNLFAALQLQKLFLTLVTFSLVIAAALVIYCVLVMLVLEKRKDIAVLRSLGASRGTIRRIFVAEGMTIGVLGTALGIAGGLCVCWILGAIEFELAYEVYRVKSLPVDVQAHEFAAAAFGALTVSYLATIYPSIRATRVPPADALRYD